MFIEMFHIIIIPNRKKSSGNVRRNRRGNRHRLLHTGLHSKLFAEPFDKLTDLFKQGTRQKPRKPFHIRAGITGAGRYAFAEVIHTTSRPLSKTGVRVLGGGAMLIIPLFYLGLDNIIQRPAAVFLVRKVPACYTIYLL